METNITVGFLIGRDCFFCFVLFLFFLKAHHFWLVFHNVIFSGIAEIVMCYVDAFLHVNYKPYRSLFFYLCCSACLCAICFYQVSCALCCHPSYRCLSLPCAWPSVTRFLFLGQSTFSKSPLFNLAALVSPTSSSSSSQNFFGSICQSWIVSSLGQACVVFSVFVRWCALLQYYLKINVVLS